jgi:hypothetical protein
MKFKGLIVLSTAVCGCGNQVSVHEEQQAQMKYVDSLWGTFKVVKELLRYDVWTITDRKHEMDSLLQLTKFFKPENLDDAEKQTLVGYAAIARVYKPAAPKYKEVVLQSEEHFYNIKALEQSVRNNTYAGNKVAFLKEYQKEKQGVNQLATEGKVILERLTEVEPMYQRLHPKVTAIIDEQMNP